MTPSQVIEFIDLNAKNLLITRDGHAALIQILEAARQQIAAAEKDDEKKG